MPKIDRVAEREKHRKVIAGNSKRAFAEAVKLEKELKEYGNKED